MRNQTRHVSLDRMADLARGRLPPAEEQSIHNHTMSCAHCAALMTRIERIVAVTSADDTEEVPPPVVARSVRLMRQRNAALLPPPRRSLLATLRFDSARTRMALGRRARPSGARQVVFETGQHDVDVRIKSAAAGWVVWGQLLGSVAGGQVELQGPATVQTELNSQGEFSLSPVPPGTYSLTLRLDDVEIGMELDIGT